MLCERSCLELPILIQLAVGGIPQYGSVINDGGNQKTKDVIVDTNAHFPIAYLEIEHPSTGFGLCSAPNLGLGAATGDIVTYLDDDNQFAR